MAGVQHGVVARRQLVGGGLGPGAIAHRLRCGRLHPIHRGVYSVGHPLVSVRGRWLAAVLACGPGAVLSHRAAAALWELRASEAATIDVTVPSLGGRRRRPGIALHRVAWLPASEVTLHHAIPVTTPARTLLDLASATSRPALARAVDRAEQLRLFDLSEVRALLRRNTGRAGCKALAQVLEDQCAEPALTRSQLEERFLALCEDHELPRPTVNSRVRGYEVDFLWREAGLIVEVDGRSSHSTRTAFERDRRRDGHLTVLGYRVLRLTYRRVVDEEESVADLVSGLLARQ